MGFCSFNIIGQEISIFKIHEGEGLVGMCATDVSIMTCGALNIDI